VPRAKSRARVPGLSRAIEVGERVFLRRPTARDRDEFLALMRNSRRLHRSWVAPPLDAAGWRAALLRARRRDVVSSLVCRREDGAIAGVVNLQQIVRGNFQNAIVGFYAGAPFAGRGYMREGLDLALRHAFESLGLHRVEANVQPQNSASRALLQRCGFGREGFSARYLKVAGRFRDHERFAIVAEDWRAATRGAAR
jgi:ribosomal-protein-alanine N-acetyltransferase